MHESGGVSRVLIFPDQAGHMLGGHGARDGLLPEGLPIHRVGGQGMAQGGATCDNEGEAVNFIKAETLDGFLNAIAPRAEIVHRAIRDPDDPCRQGPFNTDNRHEIAHAAGLARGHLLQAQYHLRGRGQGFELLDQILGGRKTG